MAMTTEQRIEAAAKAWSRERGGYFSNEDVARCIIKAAFPELVGGTAWLAPMVATPAMNLAAMGIPRDTELSAGDAADIFDAMRDAHLSPETDAKVEKSADFWERHDEDGNPSPIPWEYRGTGAPDERR